MTRLALIILATLIAGCGGVTTTRTNDTHQQKEVTRESPTPDGGRIIEKTTTFAAEGQAIQRTDPDEATTGIINAAAPILGTAIGAVTGTTGVPWGGIVGALATAAATGIAAMKHGQANSLKEQVQRHQKGEDEGWDHALELAKMVRPEDLSASTGITSKPPTDA